MVKNKYITDFLICPDICPPKSFAASPRQGVRPYRAEKIRFLLFCIDKREESFKEEKSNFLGLAGILAWRSVTTVRLPRQNSIPMVPFISARDVDALSLRLTRLAAHPGTCQSPCSYAGPRCCGFDRVVIDSDASISVRANPWRSGPPRAAARTAYIEIISEIRDTGRPGVRPVQGTCGQTPGGVQMGVATPSGRF